MKLIRLKAVKRVVPCLMLLTLAFSSCVSSPEARSARFIETGKRLLKKNDAARAIVVIGVIDVAGSRTYIAKDRRCRWS